MPADGGDFNTLLQDDDTDVPIMVMAGRFDPVTPPDGTERVADALGVELPLLPQRRPRRRGLERLRPQHLDRVHGRPEPVPRHVLHGRARAARLHLISRRRWSWSGEATHPATSTRPVDRCTARNPNGRSKLSRTWRAEPCRHRRPGPHGERGDRRSPEALGGERRQHRLGPGLRPPAGTTRCRRSGPWCRRGAARGRTAASWPSRSWSAPDVERRARPTRRTGVGSRLGTSSTTRQPASLAERPGVDPGRTVGTAREARRWRGPARRRLVVGRAGHEVHVEVVGGPRDEAARPAGRRRRARRPGRGRRAGRPEPLEPSVASSHRPSTGS